MRFAELTGSDWLFPAERNKTKVPLLRPLSRAALEVITKTPRTSDTFVLCADGLNPFSGYTRPKEKLDAASGVTGWRLHVKMSGDVQTSQPVLRAIRICEQSARPRHCPA